MFRRPLLSSLRASIGIPLAAATFLPRETSSSASAIPISSRAMHSKVVIIGSGPAAHTAAIYAARADLKPVMYEGFLALGIAAGGQLTTTDEVENYPGYKNIKGTELMVRNVPLNLARVRESTANITSRQDVMRAQSEACGTEIISQTVARVDLSRRPFKYWLHPMGDDSTEEEETHTADSVIVATGAKARRLELAGEEQYWGNGVSACAVCDGSLPIFREKPLVVIGGGDSAVEESVYLTKKASKVTVLVRRDVLRASKANAKRLASNPKIEIKYNTVATRIVGEEGARGLMTGLHIKNVKTGEETQLDANGLFYAVGHDPATSLFKGQLNMDSDGYLITEPGNTKTTVEGVFAAGDVQDKKYRQAVTSAGSGCIAALEAEKWLAEQETGDDAVPLENESEAKKPLVNGAAPEYRSNPLL